MKHWRQSVVILSLLQRPAIYKEWARVLQSQPHLSANLAWNLSTTGRVEGFPENGTKPHLQDLLEYYRPCDDAALLARIAFDKIAYSSSPPPVPLKDYKDHHGVPLQVLMDRTESWNRMMSTIQEDDSLPTNVCDLGFDTLTDAFDPKYEATI